MKNEEECNLIIDLLPSYMENLVSKKTKEIIERHLDSCEKCRKQYSMGKEEKKQKNIKDKDKEIAEYNYLKKYNKKMSWLKKIIATMLTIIILITLVISGNYLYKKHILYKISENYENLKKLDNYNITIETLDINYNTNEMDSYMSKYYYKLGKLKRKTEELKDITNFKKNVSQYSKMQISPNNIIEYFNINTKESLVIYDTMKEYAYINNRVSFYKEKGDLFNIQYNIEDFKIGIFPFLIDIKDEEYEGRKYYVLQFKSSNSKDYKEIWVDKEKLIIERIIEESNSHYREIVYTIIENNVTDNEFEIPNLKNYKEVYN